MSPFQQIASLLNASGVGVGILALAQLALRLGRAPQKERPALWMVGGLLLALTLDILSSLHDLSPMRSITSRLIWLSVMLVWPIIPLFLLGYVKAITAGEGEDWRPARWQLGAPVAMVLCWIPFQLLPGAARLGLYEGRVPPVTAMALAAVIGLLLFIVLWIAQLLAVSILIVKRITQHRKRVRQLCSNVALLDLRWLDGLLVLVVIGALIALADPIFALWSGRALLDDVGGGAFEVALLLGLALFGLGQSRALPDWADDVLEDPRPDMTIENIASNTPGNRYARSALGYDDCLTIADRLDEAMARSALWRDPFLTLKLLSEHVATKPYYVSQAINAGRDRNFFDYVNGWRVKAACEALKNSDENVLAICEASGFNSKSTFNNAFRRETGMTPTAWRTTHAGPPRVGAVAT
ncbi:AraC-like DNA-binding protein/multisubunit Na+/H+ antiporter MnhE subunit [Sphingomonas sp. UYAg733]